MSTYPNQSKNDLNDPGSDSGVLDLSVWDTCVLKYVVGVEPDLKTNNNKNIGHVEHKRDYDIAQTSLFCFSFIVLELTIKLDQ